MFHLKGVLWSKRQHRRAPTHRYKIGIDVVWARYSRVCVSQDDSGVIKGKDVLVAIFVAIFWLLSFLTGVELLAFLLLQRLKLLPKPSFSHGRPLVFLLQRWQVRSLWTEACYLKLASVHITKVCHIRHNLNSTLALSGTSTQYEGVGLSECYWWNA